VGSPIKNRIKNIVCKLSRMNNRARNLGLLTGKLKTMAANTKAVKITPEYLKSGNPASMLAMKPVLMSKWRNKVLCSADLLSKIKNILTKEYRQKIISVMSKTTFRMTSRLTFAPKTV
jgi:hypothetical protein